MTFKTRFAPSPTGPLHLGHAYSALLAQDMAGARQGQLLLRIEDIDTARSKPEWEAQIYDDLAWLGLVWPEPVLRQSNQLASYDAVLKDLWSQGLTFNCTCNRRDIQSALSAPQDGDPVPTGPDGLIYPGTCRHRHANGGQHPYPTDGAIRLNIQMVIEKLAARSSAPFSFEETGSGPNGETGHITFSAQEALVTLGDIVVARRDMGTSYHLSVVLDDAAQGISHVVRGQDLFEATKIHVILQKLLNLPTPTYHHHRLVTDDTGKRLAKRDDARAICKYRADGLTPADLKALVGL